MRDNERRYTDSSTRRRFLRTSFLLRIISQSHPNRLLSEILDGRGISPVNLHRYALVPENVIALGRDMSLFADRN